MLSHRKVFHRLCCKFNSTPSYLNLCLNSCSSSTVNYVLSSRNTQYNQSVSAGNFHTSCKTQTYNLESLLHFQSVRKYSLSPIAKIGNRLSKQGSQSLQGNKVVGVTSPISVASIIVPTVLADNHAPILQDPVTTTAIAATNAASTSDAYGWLTGYVTFLESVASSAPVLQLMSLLRQAHELTGLPWWLTIVLTTVVVRTSITLPLAFYQQYIVARVELLRGEMVELMKHLAADTRRAKQEHNWDEETTRMFFKRQSRNTWRDLVVRDNCHPAKGIVLVLAQLPLWVLLSISHRNLALARPVPDQVALTAHHQLSMEGLLWCPDLTLSDPMLLLPIAMGLVNLIITEVNVLQRPPATTRGMKGLTYFLRGAAVITVPIAMFMPSGVVLYWVTSSCCALTQTLLLLHPRLRKACGIPTTPSSQPHPYSRIATTLKERLAKKPAIVQLPNETNTVNQSSDKDASRLKKR